MGTCQEVVWQEKKTFLLLHLLPFLLSVPEPDTQIHLYLPQKSEEGGTLDNGGGADYGAIANANAIAISNAIANAYGGVVDKDSKGTGLKVRGSVCHLPFKEDGECEAYVPVYSFNGSACEQWISGGCGGNENRFETKE